MKTTQRIRTLHLLTALILLPLMAGLCYGQTDHRFTFNVGGGVTPVTGALSDRLNNGWHFTVGGGYRFTQHFEGNLQFTNHEFGLRQGLLNQVGVPDGNARLWSLTFEPKIRMGTEASRFDPYIVGGVGYYRRTVEFTSPTVAQTVLFDPIFGSFFPALVPANDVLGNITQGGVGGSLGLGFDVRVSRGLSFFTEARFHYADTGRIPTRMVPVTFGIRW